MRRQRLRLRKEAIEKFLHEYSLSEEEKDILLNRPIFENDSDVFFQVLDRACAIKQRCTELMQDPYCMMTATVELLETISSEEETAYHRLFGWCQNECRLSGDRKYCLDGSNASYLHLHQALLVLRQKESFFNHCITEFVNNRRNILAILLSENLGQWNHQSHEHPNQLLSDLFTWLHEYINEERNGIRFLLTKEGEEENDRVIANCLDVVFSGANSYIQEYVVPLFEENSNLPQLFESMQILAFYESTLSSLISSSSSICSTLLSVEQTLWTRITSLLVMRVKHYFKLFPFVSSYYLSDANEKKKVDTSSVFTELLLLLRQCFAVSSFPQLFMNRFNNATIEPTRKTELFDSLVDAALKPITENAHEYFPILDSMELSITLVNVMEELKTVVSQYGFAINYNYYLCEKSEGLMDAIIREKVCEWEFRDG